MKETTGAVMLDRREEAELKNTARRRGSFANRVSLCLPFGFATDLVTEYVSNQLLRSMPRVTTIPVLASIDRYYSRTWYFWSTVLI